MRKAEAERHFFVEEATTGAVGLDPFAVDDELGDGALADVVKDLVGGTGNVFYVDFCVGDTVMFKKALGFAAIAAPAGGVYEQLHNS